MIVYVFYEDFFRKIFLPTRIVGIYPVYYKNDRVLFNVEAVEEQWCIKPADNFSVVANGNQAVAKPVLSPNNTYLLYNNSNNMRVYVIAAPLYTPNSLRYRSPAPVIGFGKSLQNGIVTANPYANDVEYYIKAVSDSQWVVEPVLTNTYLNDKQVTAPTTLVTGDYIFCFGTVVIFIGGYFIINVPPNTNVAQGYFDSVTIKPADVADPGYEVLDDLPLYEKKDYFTKAPRFTSTTGSLSIDIEAPPPLQEPQKTPAIVTIGPQLTMLAVSVLSVLDTIKGFIEGTVDLASFLTASFTIFAMVAGIALWPLITDLYEKKDFKKKTILREKKYKEYLEKKYKAILNQKALIKDKLINEYPPLDKCQAVIESQKNTLWNKNIEDDDFLTVCIGTGTVKSDIEIELPEEKLTMEGDEDPLITLTKGLEKEAKNIDDAPFAYSFVKYNISAILGERRLCDRLIDNILLQVMTSHSFSDLKIVVYTTPDNAARWEYLRVLPHCWDNQHNLRYFATNVEEFNEIMIGLDSEFDNRKGSKDSDDEDDDGSDNESENEEPYKKFKPYYLIITDNIESIRNTSLIKKMLYYKKNLGFSLIIENENINTLPDQTHGFISVSENVSGMFTNTLKLEDLNEFKVDFTTPYNIYACAQKLANTPIQLEKGKYELPKSLSFLEMFKVGRVEQLNCLDRWKTNNPTNSLSVPVGIDQNGELFKMDLHEKVYGPHGLVAGTTGSGKSEWIISLILSLAVNFSPDEVQFVLVDYKGGGLAMSFENKELGIKLPHLAGTITNLDKSEINRSISSIESELKRRQSVFNDAREKLKEGQMDIYKYQQFYRKGLVDQPMSHLLIICDEFAELKQQQPEFMDQLISTSRIGRSLGVHLILATQKPSGVVNDQIWSNSRFKVCLRVQDQGDSNEILKKPDAAFLKTAGSFYLEVGNDEYYNLGQSAWAGAKYYPSDVVTRKVDQSVQHIDNTGKILNYFDDSDNAQKASESQGEELLNIVKYIDSLDKSEHFVKQQLWLPNIPENIYLAEIKKRYKFTPKKLDFTTAIGEYDEPRKQEQNLLTINIGDGHIAIVGQPGAGKELLLSTIIFSSVTEHTPQELNYYILDFGAETLRKFAKYPHVGEVVFQDDMERVGGTIQLVMDELAKRKVLFQEYNGSLKYYNEHSGEILPLMCLVINGYDVFSEMLSNIADTVESLFRDAARYGIIFILSAAGQNTFNSRILQYFNRFIVMNLQDELMYRDLTNCRPGLIPGNKYGRGICKTGDDDDSYCEFQTARITEEDKELVYLKQVAETLSKGYTVRAKQITTIPDNISSEDLAKYVTTIADIPIGYNFYEKSITKLDLSKAKMYPILATEIQANLGFIYALANILTKLPNTVVRVIDVLGIFEKPILDLKFFNDDFSSVFSAMRDDVKQRKETQPLAINIVLGAASLKYVLDFDAQEAAQEMFEGINDSKQNIYFLIDDYKKFKQLKLEPWYGKMDTSNGIWLGPGIDSQSVLVTNDLAVEDRKYIFEGMAYYIKDGTYTLIKTMMDGDD